MDDSKYTDLLMTETYSHRDFTGQSLADKGDE